MWYGIVLAMLAALFDAIGFIFIKRGLKEGDYRIFILISIAVGVILAAILLYVSGEGFSGLTIQGIFPFLITGGFGGGLLARITATLATDRIGAAKAHSLISANPLVTALFGIVILGEVLSFKIGTGMVAIVVGAGFLSYLTQNNLSQPLSVCSFKALSGLGFAGYSTLMAGLRPVLARVGLDLGATPLQGMFIRFLTALALYSGYLLFSQGSPNFISIWRNLSGNFILASVAWSLVPLLVLYALNYISPIMLASLLELAPLFTFILGYVLLASYERINWKIAISGVAIVGGAITVVNS